MYQANLCECVWRRVNDSNLSLMLLFSAVCVQNKSWWSHPSEEKSVCSDVSEAVIKVKVCGLKVVKVDVPVQNWEYFLCKLSPITWLRVRLVSADAVASQQSQLSEEGCWVYSTAMTRSQVWCTQQRVYQQRQPWVRLLLTRCRIFRVWGQANDLISV